MDYTREGAMAFLREHNKDDGHIKHALAVEAAMRYFAGKMDGDVKMGDRRPVA